MSTIPEGVYSETKIQKIGTMSTVRTQEITDYYHCKQLDPDTMSIQILDMYGEPMPLVEKVCMAEFLKRFKYEPDKFQKKQSVADLAAEKAVAAAENYARRKEYFSAEFEFSKALKLDVENVRANFGLGKVYVATGELEKASEVFSRLSAQQNVLEPENKHIFNELGIELRGLKLYDQAIEFYQKALDLAKDDENLCFNVARAAYEKGDPGLAAQFLDKALGLKPDFEAALKMKAALK